MAKVWLFIKAVFVHWYTLVGGCLLIVLLGLWERWRGASLPIAMTLREEAVG